MGDRIARYVRPPLLSGHPRYTFLQQFLPVSVRPRTKQLFTARTAPSPIRAQVAEAERLRKD